MTPQQQAEQLARKCAEILCRDDGKEFTVCQSDVEDIIKNNIPLQQLLEVASAANKVVDHPMTALICDEEIELHNALETLRKQGIEV